MAQKAYLRQSKQVVKTAYFNLDNGSGTTVDEVAFNSGPTGARLLRVYAIYNEACQTVASGTFQVGTTLGGQDLVAALAYTNTAAIGDITEAPIALAYLKRSQTVFVRHTGVGATQTGTAAIVIEYAPEE